MDGGDDVLDAVGDHLGSVQRVADVIGTDHEHDGLGLDAFELAVLDAPEHVLDLVAADAEVSGVVFGVFLEDVLAVASPARGDRVAEEDDLRFALLGDRDEGLMGLGEAGVDLTGLGVVLRGGDVGLLCRQTDGLLRGVFLGFLGDDGGRGEQGKPEEEG